jgi:tRNA dimethylallyltransferase
MRAIGVAQLASFLAGESTREEALTAGRTATRRYAKRQYTWFSHQPPPEWPRLTRRPVCDTLEDAVARLAQGDE